MNLILAVLLILAPVWANSMLDWKINPADANVSCVGTGENVLKLVNLQFDSENLPTIGGILDVAYIDNAGSTRHIHAWTDLSGGVAEVEEFDFVKLENRTAGKVVRTQPNLAAADNSASITIPQSLLYDEASGKYASIIYVSITTYTNDNLVHLEENQRGWGSSSQRDFLKLDNIQLNIAEPPQFTSHITLVPGTNPSQINFAWLTKAGTANAAVLQLVEPLPARTFTGVNGTAAHGFDSNKVTVTGLAKNTEYTYRVGDGKEENWSKTYTFKTYDPDSKYSVIATADPQIGSSGDRGQWVKTVAAASAQAEKQGGGPAFMLIAGDQTNYANDVSEIDAYLAPPGLKSLPVAVTIGNHDVVDMRVGPPQTGFMDKIYNWPNHNNLRSTNADTTRLRAGGNYYFSYGNTLYISINSQITNAAMHEIFMTQAIASHPGATWKIALFHHDIYGGGSHASPKGYSDSYNMQATWSPFLDKHGIDLAINGHDHVYARSRFMQGNKIIKEQMPTVLDINETNLAQANPAGAIIQPKGIQYMSLSGASAKFYALEMQPWVAYGHEQNSNNQLNTQYSIITIEGESLVFSTYRTEDDELVDAITLKKTANYADLQSLIPGMKSVQRETITTATWDAFQERIAEAEAITSTAPATAVHDMYIALYEAYYALDPSTSKTALGNLIETVTEKLATASEGRWEGQYAFGSKVQVQTVLDAAVIVYDFRLATQASIEKAFADLDDIYTWFLSTESNVPVPFIYVHEIKANEPYTMDLIDWMKADEKFFFGADDKEHYNAHFTKQIYAKDIAEAMRSDDRFGPANAEGGRGHNKAHVTKTHIGEWIRYELNVAQAGSYKATLGAANSTSSIQRIVLRDIEQNILSTFVIPANTPLTGEAWNTAGSIAGDKEFYLPAGKYVIELFFVNDGVGRDGSATANNYLAGPDVDILILERTGNMAAPVVIQEPDIFPLPFIPTTTGGAVNRQRGWATTGFACPESGLVGKDLPINVLRAATHLVMELAGPPSNSNSRTLQVNILTESLNWSQAEPLLNGANGVFKSDVGPYGALVFDLENLVFTDGPNAYQALRNITQRGRILIGYYSYGWEELNVMKAYLRIDPTLVPIAREKVFASQLFARAIGNAIVLENVPSNAKIEVYNLQGKQIYLAHSENYAKSWPILIQAKGVYIVKVGKQTLRVVVRS
ncbi:MAG: metallophosphoesterase [Fibromonadales bacterium]|nr:metallophosphoesterase [Fibromonadales bacterium]